MLILKRKMYTKSVEEDAARQKWSVERYSFVCVCAAACASALNWERKKYNDGALTIEDNKMPQKNMKKMLFFSALVQSSHFPYLFLRTVDRRQETSSNLNQINEQKKRIHLRETINARGKLWRNVWETNYQWSSNRMVIIKQFSVFSFM